MEKVNLAYFVRPLRSSGNIYAAIDCLGSSSLRRLRLNAKLRYKSYDFGCSSLEHAVSDFVREISKVGGVVNSIVGASFVEEFDEWLTGFGSSLEGFVLGVDKEFIDTYRAVGGRLYETFGDDARLFKFYT